MGWKIKYSAVFLNFILKMIYCVDVAIALPEDA